MIFLTGDTHRNELSRVFSFCKKLDVADTFIILGDVGINWYLDSSDICLEKKLGQLPPFVFCIKGNHECSRYEDLGYEKKWAEEVNGWVWQRYAGTAFAIDGETYEIEGKSFLVLGGAYSVDKWYRLQNKWKWFPEEQMTDEEKTFALETCEKIKWKIDHISIVLSTVFWSTPLMNHSVGIYFQGLVVWSLPWRKGYRQNTLLVPFDCRIGIRQL